MTDTARRMSESHPQYTKVLGDIPKLKDLGFMQKISALIWGVNDIDAVNSLSKTHEFVLRSANINAYGMQRTKSIFLDEFDEHLKKNANEINLVKRCLSLQYEEFKKYSYPRFYVYRTPLEKAIEIDSPIEVIMKLLENGAKPTNTACSIITLKLMQLDQKKDDYKKVVEILSFAGANWSKPVAKFVDKIKADHPSSNFPTPMCEFIVRAIGEKEAHSLGVSNTSYQEHEIDLERFVKNIKKIRVKRLGDNLGEDVEISIPEKSKSKWAG